MGGRGIGVGLGEPSVALVLNEGGRYISQVWEDGTVCDLTGLKRRTEVQVSGLQSGGRFIGEEDAGAVVVRS